MIAVTFSSDGFRVKMQRILSTTRNPRAIMAAAGREGANELRKHFREKDRTPNKLGGKREHFWRQVMQSVQSPIVASSGHTVTIHITDPRFAQKVFGGRITAKKARALTIPVEPEAYGRATSTFEKETGVKLFLISPEFGEGMLAGQIGNAIEVFYVLRASVDQDADPTALPPQQEFEDAITDRAQRVLDRQITGGTSNV